MQQVVTLTAVEEKKTGVNKRGPWALRIFKTAGGTTFQTFDVDLGDKASGLLNQSVEVEYEEEENGNFTNNVLRSIKAVPGSAPSTLSVLARPTLSVNAAPQDEFRRSKQEMRRTESVKAAATILASPHWDPNNVNIEALRELTEKIAALIESGATAEEAVRF